MEVRCDKCQARYKVDDARIGPQGLTMRCGKCQNTFKVMKPAPADETTPSMPKAPPPPAPKAPAPTPASAKPPPPKEGATMMFAAPNIAKPLAPPPPAAKPPPPAAKPAPPAPKPAAPAAAKPAPKPPAAAAPAEEGAGRTMMFQTGNLKVPPPGAPPAKPAATKPPPAKPPQEATMVFGQSPIAPAAKPKPAEGAGSTMMFAATPVAAKPLAKPAPPPPQPAPVAEPEPEPEPEPAPEPEPEAEAEAAGEAAAEENDAEAAPESAATPADGSPPAAMADEAHDEQDEATAPGTGGGSGVEAEGAESNIEAEGAEEETAATPGAFDKAPPKGLLIGVGAGIAALIVAGLAIVMVKKLGKHAPPPQAIEMLAAASAAADKDSLASIAEAEGKAKDALDVAGAKSYFPQATAALAVIEIQWADALNDQAALWTDRGAKAAEAGNDAKKTEADAKAAEAANQAKTRLKSAFEAVAPALKLDQKSPDLELALADYYRAQRSNSNMNKELKKAQALKAEPARVSLVQGLAAAQEDDGAEKALPKLKEALAASPQSARIHFRLAQAYMQMKDDANAAKELKETLKISPQHERAKAALESMAASSAAEQK